MGGPDVFNHYPAFDKAGLGYLKKAVASAMKLDEAS
jgi:hypothetical protein